MNSNFLTLLYATSGWAVNIATLCVALFALWNRKNFRRQTSFLGIDFVLTALVQLWSSISAFFLSNNLFIDHFYVPLDFLLLSLYLIGSINTTWIKRIVSIVVLFGFTTQIYTSLFASGMKNFNAFGAYISLGILLIVSLFNLTTLFRDFESGLRLNPNLWFMGSIFCLSFLGIAVMILVEVTYASHSASSFYSVYIPYNFIQAVFIYGYYKGIKLLR